jgi:phosphomevalonate kinase
MFVRARAPGKLIVAGEYAVLAGAPGIAIAVPPFAEATLARCAESRLRSTGGSGDMHEAAGFVVNPNAGLTWTDDDPGDHGRLISALADVLIGQSPEWCDHLNAIDVVLDTRTFHSADGAKLGLGSSAAITVALIAALYAIRGEDTTAAHLVVIAREVHCQLQGGHGSGIDIAASAYGGVGVFEGGIWTPASWPAGLSGLAVSTGIAASTGDRIRRYRAAELSKAPAWCAALDDLCQRSRDVAAAWSADDGGTVLRCLEQCGNALARLDAAGDIGIVSAPHKRIAALAARCGAVYKPSGAGGGDFGLAFSDDAARIEAFAAACHENGLETRVLDHPRAGVRTEIRP